MIIEAYKNEVFLPKQKKIEHTSDWLVFAFFFFWCFALVIISAMFKDGLLNRPASLLNLAVFIGGTMYIVLKITRDRTIYTRSGIQTFNRGKVTQEIKYEEIESVAISELNTGSSKEKGYKIELFSEDNVLLTTINAKDNLELSEFLFLLTVDSPHLRDDVFNHEQEEQMLEWIKNQELIYRKHKKVFMKNNLETYFITLRGALLWIGLVIIGWFGICLVGAGNEESLRQLVYDFLTSSVFLIKVGLLIHFIHFLTLLKELGRG